MRCSGVENTLPAGIFQLQPREHEQHQMLPAVEAQVLGQRSDMLKEGIAAGEGGAKKGAALVFELQHRVEQKRQDVQRQQRLRQIPFTVPEVVLEVIPLGDIFVWVATLSRLVILYKTPYLFVRRPFVDLLFLFKAAGGYFDPVFFKPYPIAV